MTEYQKKRIKEITEEWIKEVDSLPPTEPSVNGFNNNVNKPLLELEKKYKEKLRQVKDEVQP